MTGKAILWLACAFLAMTASAAAQTKLDKELQEQVNLAIDKGAGYLSKLGVEGHRDATHWLGRQALVGWTLLECGVAAKDEVVQKYAAAVREGVLNQDVTNANYGLSTALIFLDKLGDPSDAPLIESITVRLLAAQSPSGGWGYTAPPLKAAERERLRKALEDRRALVAAGKELNDKKRSAEEIRKDLTRYIREGLEFPTGYNVTSDDNSNTQFTMMALWVARRHEMPVGSALALSGKRFRMSQTQNGAWLYNHPFVNGRAMPIINVDAYLHPAMTCVGLIGLALEKGVQQKTKDLRKDALVQRAFDRLGAHIEPLAAAAPPPKAGPAGAPGNPLTPMPPAQFSPMPGGRADNYYYFLFSVERAAVLYDIDKIGKTDWYAWGAQDLVRKQAFDGAWHGHYEAWNADTCFALLFLKRANVAHDLTDLVRGIDRRPKLETPQRDPLLDLPLIIPKAEKREKKTAPK